MGFFDSFRRKRVTSNQGEPSNFSDLRLKLLHSGSEVYMISRIQLVFPLIISLSLSLNCFAQAIGIGDNHPDSGTFSPVDETNWDSATWDLGSKFTSNGDLEIALYSRHTARILLEIYSSSTGSNATYDYWMQRGPDNIWRARIANVPDKTLPDYHRDSAILSRR